MNPYQTDNPNEETRQSINEAMQYQRSRQRTTLVIFLILVVGVFLAGIVNGSDSLEVAVDANTLGVAGPEEYTHFIALADITEVTMIEEFEAGEAVDAIDSKTMYVGIYENELFGEYEIIAYQSCTTVIAVYTQDAVFVVNGTSESATQKYYDTIAEAADGYTTQ